MLFLWTIILFFNTAPAVIIPGGYSGPLSEDRQLELEERRLELVALDEKLEADFAAIASSATEPKDERPLFERYCPTPEEENTWKQRIEEDLGRMLGEKSKDVVTLHIEETVFGRYDQAPVYTKMNFSDEIRSTYVSMKEDRGITGANLARANKRAENMELMYKLGFNEKGEALMTAKELRNAMEDNGVKLEVSTIRSYTRWLRENVFDGEDEYFGFSRKVGSLGIENNIETAESNGVTTTAEKKVLWPAYDNSDMIVPLGSDSPFPEVPSLFRDEYQPPAPA